ncbi:MAG: HEAT repeat domain-containing protein [Candidatus Riflebacteria bacterium]|nr:HEAT repeat domain-containing protein [Candidatus Riflebacteria bacterium]
MNTLNTSNESKTSRDEEIRQLSSKIRRLKKSADRIKSLSSKKVDVALSSLSEQICDIIELKGLSVSMLLHFLPTLPELVQKEISRKLEDYFYFHPENGKKLIPRLITTIEKSHQSCHAHLLCTIADIFAATDRKKGLPDSLQKFARNILNTNDTDYVRKAKAIEVLTECNTYSCIPQLIESLGQPLKAIDKFENFQFIEAILFALKNLGGDGILRLIMNPFSTEGNSQLQSKSAGKSKVEVEEVQDALKELSQDERHILLKVIDLSEFGLPFLPMVQEALASQDKWIRQTAVNSLSTIKQKNSLERIFQMMNDPAPEVRLIAVTALGNFSADETGEHLKTIAFSESETPEIRMNALYALFNQKNSAALENLWQSPAKDISLNAIGLFAMLMPKSDGIKLLLEKFDEHTADAADILFHYLLDISLPDDLAEFSTIYSKLNAGEKRNQFFEFLHRFVEKQAGPNLNAAIEKLPPAERTAISILIPETKA